MEYQLTPCTGYYLCQVLDTETPTSRIEYWNVRAARVADTETPTRKMSAPAN